ncbi:MAG TPA: hypothetical protein PK109_02925 [Candidatus Paceibacterota bacterium]|nr:hypothetical protein [Candidatus Paceibacterota bacterium]
MATKKSTTKKAGTKKKGIPAAGIAAGVVAAGAAAGAAYYFYGAKGAKQHRAKARKWAGAMKREVIKEAKMIQKLDDKVIHGVIDRVANTYRAAKSVNPEEIREAAMELKNNWKKIQAEMKGARSTVKRTAKKAVKKSAKRRA